jgi:hypothetical protein
MIYDNASDDETVVHSNKKHALSLAPYAKYGMVFRKLPQRKLGMFSCLILFKGWPSWFWVARARNLDVKMVILGSTQWKGLLQSLYPATEFYV